MDVRARHAGVQHVAHDGHGEVAEILLVVADGVHVQQPLRGVGMAAVACVDHVHGAPCCAIRYGAPDSLLPHHEQVSRHGAQVGDGVERRLAFAGRAARDVEVDHVPADRRLAAISNVVRVRVLFSKNRLNTLCRAAGHLLHFAVVHAHEVGSGVEDVRDDVARQGLRWRAGGSARRSC